MAPYHSAIKKKPVDVKSNTCFDFDKKNNERDNKFKVGDHVKISKYQKKMQQITFQIDLKKLL